MLDSAGREREGEGDRQRPRRERDVMNEYSFKPTQCSRQAMQLRLPGYIVCACLDTSLVRAWMHRLCVPGRIACADDGSAGGGAQACHRHSLVVLPKTAVDSSPEVVNVGVLTIPSGIGKMISTFSPCPSHCRREV